MSPKLNIFNSVDFVESGWFFVARMSNVLTTFGWLCRIRQNRLYRIWLSRQCVPGLKDHAFLPSTAGICFWDQISSARSQRSENTLSGVYTRGLNRLMSGGLCPEGGLCSRGLCPRAYDSVLCAEGLWSGGLWLGSLCPRGFCAREL